MLVDFLSVIDSADFENERNFIAKTVLYSIKIKN